MSRRKTQNSRIKQPALDLGALLHGSPDWPDVVEFFRYGEFDEETYLVEAIKKYLRTEAQRQQLFAFDMSIEDMLNGRFQSDCEFFVETTFREWNQRLGFKKFGF